MPLFCMLSGFFFKWNYSLKDFIKKKSCSILLPYFVWCFITYVVFRSIGDIYNLYVYNEHIHFMAWLNCFCKSLTTWGWWFLRALAFSFIYAYCSIKITRKRVCMSMSLSVLFLWICSFSGIIPNNHPTLNGFIYLYPFFAFAIIIGRKWSFIEKHSKLIFIIFLFVFIILQCFWKGYPDTFYRMNTSVFEPEGAFGIIGVAVITKTLYRFLLGVSGSITIILLFRMLSYPPKIVHLIQPIGTSTLGIYILHSFVFDLFPKRQLFESEIASFLGAALISILIIAVCYFIIAFTSRYKLLRFLLWGKK